MEERCEKNHDKLVPTLNSQEKNGKESKRVGEENPEM